MIKSWKQYEEQVFNDFKKEYPDQIIEYNKQIRGRYSLTKRQIDILIKVKLADTTQIGVFDCKKFNKKIDVKVVDSMVGFMDDLNANYVGIITCIGFSKAAQNRAEKANIKLEIIKFESSLQVIKHFVPSLDFSDSRNSMYINIIH